VTWAIGARIDIARQRYGFDLIEIRRRNLVATGSDAV